jgi:hypothetical protein
MPAQSRNTGQRGEGQRSEAPAREGLEQLPLDQRLAYYKQKYDGKTGDKGRDNAPRDSRSPRPQGQRRRPDKSQNRQPGMQPNKSGQSNKAGPAGAIPQPAQNSPAPAGAAKKPGLVGKLLGIFKRKK